MPEPLTSCAIQDHEATYTTEPSVCFGLCLTHFGLHVLQCLWQILMEKPVVQRAKYQGWRGRIKVLILNLLFTVQSPSSHSLTCVSKEEVYEENLVQSSQISLWIPCVCVCSELSVPKMVSVQKDLESQTLTLSWQSDASYFDVEIYHTELMELVLNVRSSDHSSDLVNSMYVHPV